MSNESTSKQRTVPSLILIFGQPLSLKSTLGLNLAWRLHCGLVSTGFFGRVPYNDESEKFKKARDVRYEACASLSECYMQNGWRTVVEGNFDTPERRQLILEIARRYKVAPAIVRCTCSNFIELKRRQAERKDNVFALDHDADPYSDAPGSVMSPHLDPDELIGLPSCEIYEVDTGDWTLKVSTEPRGDRWLAEILKAWIVFAKELGESR